MSLKVFVHGSGDVELVQRTYARLRAWGFEVYSKMVNLDGTLNNDCGSDVVEIDTELPTATDVIVYCASTSRGSSLEQYAAFTRWHYPLVLMLDSAPNSHYLLGALRSTCSDAELYDAVLAAHKLPNQLRVQLARTEANAP